MVYIVEFLLAGLESKEGVWLIYALLFLCR